MTLLLAGLILFPAFTRSAPFVSRAPHDRPHRRRSLQGTLLVVSAAGLVLIVWGFAALPRHRLRPGLSPPAWLHPIVLVLMWFAFVALAAAYSPPGWIKGMLAIQCWSASRAGRSPTCWPNGDLGALVLFGAFLPGRSMTASPSNGAEIWAHRGRAL